MSELNNNGKKIKNVATLDLRSINEESTIEELENVALVIFPKTDDIKIKSKISSLILTNVATVVYMDEDAQLNMINGERVFNFNDIYNNNKFLLINGKVVIKDPIKVLSEPTEKKPQIYLNGSLYVQKRLRNYFDIIQINGEIFINDFDEIIFLNNKPKLDKAMLQEIKPRTLIVAEDVLKVDKDISVEDLKSKSLLFYSNNKIKASKNIKSYLNALMVKMQND